MSQGNRITFCTVLWLAIAGAPASARDDNVRYHRLVKRAPPASNELAEISTLSDAELLAAGFQPIGVVTILRPELRCDFEHQCVDLPGPYDATAEARKQTSRHGAQVLTLPCNNADVIRRTQPKGFFSTLKLEQECRTVPDVHAPGKYKQECTVARRYWDRTLLRVARGVAWHRSSNEHAERNLKEGYRLLFRKDPLLRACLEENSAGMLRDSLFPNRPVPRPPRDRETQQADPRDEIPPAAGQPALIVSAAANDAQGVQAQLAAGAPIDMQIAGGETALHYAAAAGAIESMRVLLESGADVNARNKHGATPLYIAARHDKRDAVAMLIEHGALIDDQSLNFLDLTPLMVAGKYGHLGVVQELLARGADFERRDKKGLDALAHAAAAEHGALIEPLLVRMNAEQRTQALKGALYVASTQDKPGAISALAKAGADLEYPYAVSIGQTRTPLMLAAASGHVEAARALLDAGADASRPEIVRAIRIATPPNTYGLEPIVDRLLAQPALPERSLQILLANALQACHMPLAERIVAAGGQALIDRKEPRLLAGAVHCGEPGVVDYLVQRGYDVDQPLSPSKDTPLMKAAQNGEVELVEYLLAHEADPALVDAGGRNAHAIALEYSRLRIVKMLREVQR